MKQRVINILIALDQFLFCLVTLGSSAPDETASSATYRLELAGATALTTVAQSSNTALTTVSTVSRWPGGYLRRGQCRGSRRIRGQWWGLRRRLQRACAGGWDDQRQHHNDQHPFRYRYAGWRGLYEQPY